MGADPNQISAGMKVYGADGNKLGKVLEVGPTSFAIEKGFFFPKAYVVSYAEVAKVDNDDAHLTYTRDEFLSGRRSTPQAEARSLQGPPIPIERPHEEKKVPVIFEEVDVVEFTGPSEPREQAHESGEQAHAMKDRTPASDEEQVKEPSRADSDNPYQF